MSIYCSLLVGIVVLVIVVLVLAWQRVQLSNVPGVIVIESLSNVRALVRANQHNYYTSSNNQKTHKNTNNDEEYLVKSGGHVSWNIWSIVGDSRQCRNIVRSWREREQTIITSH